MGYEDDIWVLGLHGGVAGRWLDNGNGKAQPIVGGRLGVGPRDLLAFYLDFDILLPVGGDFGLAFLGLVLELRPQPSTLIRGRLHGGTDPIRLGFDAELIEFIEGAGEAGSVGLRFDLSPQITTVRRLCEFGPCDAVGGEDYAFLWAISASIGLEVRM